MTRPPASPQRFLVLPAVKPRLAYALLVVNILVFLPQALAGSEQWLLWGEKNNAAIAAGQWWRLVTPIFLHYDVTHILINSISLYILGPQAEALLGYRRFLIVYLLSGISGVALSFVLTPELAAGASGALFGLIGFQIVYFYRHRALFGDAARRRLVDALVVAGGNLLFALVSNLPIDSWAHLGGLLGGGVLTWLMGPVYALQADPAAAGQTRVVDASPLSGQRWLGPLAVGLALLAIVLVTATTYR